MPWFLNPSVYSSLPVYQNPELYLFLAKLAATGLFARALGRRGLGGRRLAAGVWLFFYGLFLAAMLAAHTLVILGLRLFERPAGAPFVYDFHFYSLLLLGVVLFWQGVRCVRLAARAAAGDEAARREAANATLVVAGLAVPLIPLQFFGGVLTALSLLNFAALFLLLPRGEPACRTAGNGAVPARA